MVAVIKRANRSRSIQVKLGLKFIQINDQMDTWEVPGNKALLLQLRIFGKPPHLAHADRDYKCSRVFVFTDCTERLVPSGILRHFVC